MSGNTSNHQEISDQQLDRHASALRDEPVPMDGPSPHAMQATLNLLRADQTTLGRRSFFERAIHMTFAQRIAAAVTITIGALTLYFIFGVFSILGASVAFADVAGKLGEARTIQYTSSVSIPGKGEVKIRTLIAEPDRMRTELPDGTVSIMNGRGMLMLDPKTKTATKMLFDHGEDDGKLPAGVGGHDLSLVKAMRSLGEMKGESIGEKVIDGIPSVGFKTEIGGRPATIWANKKTADPVRVERAARAGGFDATMVMSDFVIDAPLDDALFSLDPPPGYTLKEQEIVLPTSGNLVDDVVGVLSAYTEKSEDHRFPADLFDWADIGTVTGDTRGMIGGISGRLFARPGTYGYAGKGVKRGEKDKIVFWTKTDDKATTYDAVFGDLRIETVTADQLPKPATTSPKDKTE